MRSPKPRFKGKLAEPIFQTPWKDRRKPLPGHAAKRDISDHFMKTVNSEINKRMALLLEHYELHTFKDPVRWQFLALNLAFDFVPGFKIGRAPDAPKILCARELDALQVSGEALVLHKGLPERPPAGSCW